MIKPLSDFPRVSNPQTSRATSKSGWPQTEPVQSIFYLLPSNLAFLGFYTVWDFQNFDMPLFIFKKVCRILCLQGPIGFKRQFLEMKNKVTSLERIIWLIVKWGKFLLLAISPSFPLVTSFLSSKLRSPNVTLKALLHLTSSKINSQRRQVPKSLPPLICMHLCVLITRAVPCMPSHSEALAGPWDNIFLTLSLVKLQWLSGERGNWHSDPPLISPEPESQFHFWTWKLSH